MTGEIALAAGLWRDGRQHRHAALRELSGDELRELLDREAAALPAERVTALLAAALIGVGSVAPVGEDEVRELPVGDRDRLVLAVRRLLYGDALECLVDCACGETLELALDVRALLGSEPAAVPRTATASAADGEPEITVRAVSGADHERAARRALADPAAAGRELLSACLLGPPAPLDGASAARAETLLAALDPAAELLLDGSCPACGQPVVASFDPIAHLWTELEQHRLLLEHEVHVLALHYHWSEQEIVALAPPRRARYLAQLDRYLATR